MAKYRIDCDGCGENIAKTNDPREAFDAAAEAGGGVHGADVTVTARGMWNKAKYDKANADMEGKVTASTPNPAGSRRIEYDGVEMAVADIPSVFDRAMLGYGHFPSPGGRPVLDVPGRAWPYTPETCPTDDCEGEWIDPQHLVCTGCGLDCT